MTIDIESRFIAACVIDGSLDRLNECRLLPVDVFEDYENRKTWTKLRNASTRERAESIAAHYAPHGGVGMEYLLDRDTLFLRALAMRGLDQVDEWKKILPKTDRQKEWLVVNGAALIDAPPEPPPEIMHGLLYQSGTMMMSGASKSMKTYTMIAAGLAVATGNLWMGFETTATPVVYLNLELQDFAMAARVKAVASAAGISAPSCFHVVNLRGQLVNIDALERQLATVMRDTMAGLVIIDPHYKISAASGVEENSNDEQGLLLYRLENLVCKSGAALMIAHHFSKGDKSQTKAMDRAAGGGALARWPDVVMTLTDHEDEGCATAEFSLRNFAPVSPFVVRWRYPTWTRDDSKDPAKLKKAGRSTEHPASELLAKLTGGMNNAEWREASGLTDGTFRRKRDELLKVGNVRLTMGCYFTNAPESPKSP